MGSLPKEDLTEIKQKQQVKKQNNKHNKQKKWKQRPILEQKLGKVKTEEHKSPVWPLKRETQQNNK